MSNEQLLVISFIVSVGAAILSGWFADRKGRSVVLWALVGFLLGVIGLIIIMVLPNRRRAV